MRFKHKAVDLAKKNFLVRLSYIIKNITSGDITQRNLARYIGCAASTISAVKNERINQVSMENMMRIADALKLTYTIEYQGRNGRVKQIVKVESGVDYMKSCPVYFHETRGVVVAQRRNSVNLH